MRRGALGTSFRRRILDQDLTEACSSLRGLIIDLGGEWLGRRGSFRPPHRADLFWKCLNLDPSVKPDAVADVARIPLGTAGADAVVCSEVLEHVPCPARVLSEAYRILRPGGVLIASMPFLYPVHPDPFDYQRYAPAGLEMLVRHAGFIAIEIRAQGLYFTALSDMVRSGLARVRPALLRWTLAAIALPTARLLIGREHRDVHSPFVASYPAGHFVLASKPSDEAS